MSTFYFCDRGKKDIKIKDIQFTDNEAIEAKWATLDKIHEMEQKGEFIPGRTIKKEEFNEIIKKLGD